MTLGEAFAELGIPEGTPLVDARKAYTRGLRGRKPEVDPVGFARWREAWECIQASEARPEPEPEPHFAPPCPRVGAPGAPVRGFDAYAEAWEAAAAPDRLLPGSVHEALDLILTLLRVNNSAYAGRISRAVNAALRVRGGVEAALVEPQRTAWNHATLICELAPELPPPVVVILARAVVTGDWEAAAEVIHRHRTGPEGVRMLGLLNRRGQPLLDLVRGRSRRPDLVPDILPDIDLRADVPRTPSPTPPNWVVLLILVFMGMSIASKPLSALLRAPEEPVHRERVIPTRFDPASRVARADKVGDAIARMREARDAACAHPSDTCASIEAILAGLEQGSCAAWGERHAVIDSGAAAADAPAFRAATLAANLACPYPFVTSP